MGLCTHTALMQESLPQLIKLRPDLGPLTRRRETLLAALHTAGAEIAPGRHTFFVYARCLADDLSTVKSLAAELDVSETQVVHLALSKLAEEVLPAYEPDDGPLTAAQLNTVRKLAKAAMPVGKVIDKQSLF